MNKSKLEKYPSTGCCICALNSKVRDINYCSRESNFNHHIRKLFSFLECYMLYITRFNQKYFSVINKNVKWMQGTHISKIIHLSKIYLHNWIHFYYDYSNFLHFHFKCNIESFILLQWYIRNCQAISHL